MTAECFQPLYQKTKANL